MLDLKDYGITMWEEEKIASFREKLLAWYDAHKRDLPWRRTQDPYKIWISEIMLQQTQVPRVLPKYRDFIRSFPNFRSLQRASLQEVLTLWSGLGYNRRALALKRTAEEVVCAYRGRIAES